MRITLDAMGGDNAPEATVHGAVWAARDFGLEVELVGKPDVIEAELAKHNTEGLRLPILPASEVIEMEDAPAEAVRSKKDASMNVGIRQVKEGASQAFVTAGNSGGALAAGLFGLGRIKGIKRPALSTVYPTQSPHGRCFILDVGANTEVKPEYLYQFALMGSIYTEQVLGIPNPRVGLVSNGEEEGKGSQIVVEAARLMKNGPFNFIGNVEGKDIPAGLADVVVTDGFTGNVIIKLSEGLATWIYRMVKSEIKARPLAVAGAVLAQGAFKAIEKRLDYREFGGGALLGVNGVVIVTHGRSDAYTIRNALHVAQTAVEHDIIKAIRQYQRETST
ncbi:MAG: phosphate acyltransferase PlsX [Caldilineae bacterium]|nr:MAG: phosphate acyltransferase PlsX [Caldilineae bacterium]